jgi:predicted nucleic acid-binding protein
MTPRVFLDANILFSAAYRSDSRLRVLFELAAAGRMRLVASRFAHEEARRNLAAKRPAALADLDTLLAQVEIVREGGPSEVAAASMLPAKDAPILAAAIAARCDWLVTGDAQHFGSLFGKQVHGVRVTTPAEMLRALLAGDPPA